MHSPEFKFTGDVKKSYSYGCKALNLAPQFSSHARLKLGPVAVHRIIKKTTQVVAQYGDQSTIDLGFSMR